MKFKLSKKREPEEPAEQFDSEKLKDKLERESSVYQMLLKTEDDPESRKIGLLIALVFHLLLITVTIPSFSRPQLQDKKKEVVYVSRWVPPPPPKIERPKQVIQEELNALSKQGRWLEMAGRIDDELLERIAVVGPYDEIADRLRARCEKFADRVSLVAPSVADPERLAEAVRELKRP